MSTTQEIIDRLENVSLEFVGDVRAVKAAADRLRELEAELMRQRNELKRQSKVTIVTSYPAHNSGADR